MKNLLLEFQALAKTLGTILVNLSLQAENGYWNISNAFVMCFLPFNQHIDPVFIRIWSVPASIH